MSGLCPCVSSPSDWGARLSMIWPWFRRVFNYRVVLNLTYDVITQNKSRKWFTVSKQANIHTHKCNETTPVWGSLRLTPVISTVFVILKTKSHGYIFSTIADKLIPGDPNLSTTGQSRWYVQLSQLLWYTDRPFTMNEPRKVGTKLHTIVETGLELRNSWIRHFWALDIPHLTNPTKMFQLRKCLKWLEYCMVTLALLTGGLTSSFLCWLYSKCQLYSWQRPLWLKHPGLKFATSIAQNVFIHNYTW